MIICNKCGHVFDESEWGDYGECPSCRSTETAEAERCEICGEWFDRYETVNLMWCCDDCFQKYLTPERFLEYATTGVRNPTDADILEDFILYEIFDIDEPLRYSSLAFKEHCTQVFNELVKSGQAMEKIEDYFERNPDNCSDYSDWLVDQKKGGKL